VASERLPYKPSQAIPRAGVPLNPARNWGGTAPVVGISPQNRNKAYNRPSNFQRYVGSMNTFVIHMSDASGVDEQAAIVVQDAMDLGRAAQVALDQMVERHGGQLAFPIFVDIHPAQEFQSRSWMHPAKTGTSVHSDVLQPVRG